MHASWGYCALLYCEQFCHVCHLDRSRVDRRASVFCLQSWLVFMLPRENATALSTPLPSANDQWQVHITHAEELTSCAAYLYKLHEWLVSTGDAYTACVKPKQDETCVWFCGTSTAVLWWKVIASFIVPYFKMIDLQTSVLSWCVSAMCMTVMPLKLQEMQYRNVWVERDNRKQKCCHFALNIVATHCMHILCDLHFLSFHTSANFQVFTILGVIWMKLGSWTVEK